MYCGFGVFYHAEFISGDRTRPVCYKMYGFIMFHQTYNCVDIISNDNDQNYNLRLP